VERIAANKVSRAEYEALQLVGNTHLVTSRKCQRSCAYSRAAVGCRAMLYTAAGVRRPFIRLIMCGPGRSIINHNISAVLYIPTVY